MKNIEQLRKEYINRSTYNWDAETKQKYMSNVEEEFCVWYGGYLEAIKELSHEIMPILEFTKGRLDSGAGIFQSSVSNLIEKLKEYNGLHTNY